MRYTGRKTGGDQKNTCWKFSSFIYGIQLGFDRIIANLNMESNRLDLSESKTFPVQFPRARGNILKRLVLSDQRFET